MAISPAARRSPRRCLPGPLRRARDGRRGGRCCGARAPGRNGGALPLDRDLPAGRRRHRLYQGVFRSRRPVGRGRSPLLRYLGPSGRRMASSDPSTPVLDLLTSMTLDSVAASSLHPRPDHRRQRGPRGRRCAGQSRARRISNRAVSVGIDADRIRGILTAIAPIVGAARVASATVKIRRAVAVERGGSGQSRPGDLVCDRAHRRDRRVRRRRTLQPFQGAHRRDRVRDGVAAPSRLHRSRRLAALVRATPRQPSLSAPRLVELPLTPAVLRESRPSQPASDAGAGIAVERVQPAPSAGP